MQLRQSANRACPATLRSRGPARSSRRSPSTESCARSTSMARWRQRGRRCQPIRYCARATSRPRPTSWTPRWRASAAWMRRTGSRRNGRRIRMLSYSWSNSGASPRQESRATRGSLAAMRRAPTCAAPSWPSFWPLTCAASAGRRAGTSPETRWSPSSASRNAQAWRKTSKERCGRRSSSVAFASAW